MLIVLFLAALAGAGGGVLIGYYAGRAEGYKRARIAYRLGIASAAFDRSGSLDMGRGMASSQGARLDQN